MRVRDNKVTPTIDNFITIDVLDGSGSMGGYNKSYNSKMSLGMAGIKKAYNSVNGEYKLIVFDEPYNIQVFNTPDEFKYNFGGSTALTDAIIKAFELTKDKDALINIYTDGGENASKANYEMARKLIRENKHRVTVTFIGTELDVKTAISKYEIESSNTLTYDNTAKGLFKSMETTVTARAIYSDRKAKGLDVSKGFYKIIDSNS